MLLNDRTSCCLDSQSNFCVTLGHHLSTVYQLRVSVIIFCDARNLKDLRFFYKQSSSVIFLCVLQNVWQILSWRRNLEGLSCLVLENFNRHFSICSAECLADISMKQESWKTVLPCFGQVQQPISYRSEMSSL